MDSMGKKHDPFEFRVLVTGQTKQVLTRPWAALQISAKVGVEGDWEELYWKGIEMSLAKLNWFDGGFIFFNGVSCGFEPEGSIFPSRGLADTPFHVVFIQHFWLVWDNLALFFFKYSKCAFYDSLWLNSSQLRVWQLSFASFLKQVRCHDAMIFLQSIRRGVQGRSSDISLYLLNCRAAAGHAACSQPPKHRAEAFFFQMWVKSQKGFIWYSQTLQVKVYLLSGGDGFLKGGFGGF